MLDVAPPAASGPWTLEHLAPAADRDRVEGELAAFLAGSRREFAANPHAAALLRRAEGFVLRGGKRLRPRLCLASYRIASRGGAEPPRPVRLAAASLELFHAFMLVHDDLVDASRLRRGEPTLHEAIRLDGPEPDGPASAKRSGDLALVVGDLLCALGLRLVGRSGLEGPALAAANRQVADMLLETGLGEALDVIHDALPLEALDESQVIEAYLRKTARYSVSAPLVLGATLAGASASACRALGRFGDLLGLGYQIQNDLDALAADPDRGEHADLDGGKRTLVLWTAHRLLGPSGRRALDEALGLPPGPIKRRRLLDLIAASGAAAECRDRLQSLRREAVAALREPLLDAEQGRAYVALTGLLPQHAPGPEVAAAPIAVDAWSPVAVAVAPTIAAGD